MFRAGDVDALVHLGVMHDPRAKAADSTRGTSRGTVETARVLLRAVSSAQGRAALERKRLWASPGQSAVPDRGSAAHGRARHSRGCATSSKSTGSVSTFLWNAPEIETVILRPIHILSTVANASRNYLRIRVRRPCSLRIRWCSRPFDDVAKRSTSRSCPGVRGIYNIVGPGEVPLSAVLGELGACRGQSASGRRPCPVARVPARHLELPGRELDFIRYVCMVDGRRAAAELGFGRSPAAQTMLHAVEPA